MGILDPRPDDRPPTYFRGQWFGTIPHSRVIVYFPQANGFAEPLKGGCVLPAFGTMGSDPNQLTAVWQGRGTAGGVIYDLSYAWYVVDVGAGQAVTEVNI